MKRKSLRIFTSIVIASITTLSLFSCDQPKDIETEYTANTEGYIYTVISDTGEDDTLVPYSGSLLGDKLSEHYDNIEKQLGCTIDCMSMTDSKIINRISASAAANAKFADLVQTDALTLSTLYKTEYLTPLENIPFIDPASEKWGLASQRAFLTFNGKSYGFFGLWLGASFPTVSGIMLYNRDMLSDYGVADPMELYESDAWTWYNFRSVAKAVTFDTGDESSTYAFPCPNSTYPDFIYAAVASNGGSRCITDDSGKTVCGYNSRETIDALEWVHTLINDDKTAFPINMNYNNGYLDILSFTNLRTAFLVTNAYNGVRSDTDYPLDTFGAEMGWLPFPSGVGVDPGTYAATFNEYDTAYAIAVTDTQSIYDGAQILDAIFEPMEGLDSTEWKTELENNYFFDKASYNVYFRLLSVAHDDGFLIDTALNKAVNAKFADVVTGSDSAVKAVTETESVVDSYLNTK